MRKTILGFSGGVDSAVAALRLRNSQDVTALFLDTGVKGALEDARKTADFLRLPLVIRDARDALEKNVCRPFLDGYLQGRTINPCLICNPTMKLKMLVDYADEVGADYISTGHYAVCENGALFEGCAENDQSYQLSLINKAQLSRLLLPLGLSKKSDVRAEAAEAGIPIAHKPDSMDICFIPDHDYRAWIESRAPAPLPGTAYLNGAPIAMHKGIHRYTVGQRWDELFNARRLYVSKITPAENRIDLVYWDDLFKSEITVNSLNWLVEPARAPFRARVRARHTRWEMPECTVTPTAPGLSVICDSPLRAPAKGQTAAIYVNRQVVCAGEIA